MWNCGSRKKPNPCCFLRTSKYNHSICLTTISETSVTFNFHTHNFRKFSPQAFTQTQTSKSLPVGKLWTNLSWWLTCNNLTYGDLLLQYIKIATPSNGLWLYWSHKPVCLWCKLAEAVQLKVSQGDLPPEAGWREQMFTWKACNCWVHVHQSPAEK